MQINKRNQSHEEIWQKLSFLNPYDKNPNQEHKTLQNIIQGSKVMKRIYNYLRNVNGMKNHSNWLGFNEKNIEKGVLERMREV